MISAIFFIAALLASVQAQCPSGGVLVDGSCWYIAFFNSGTPDCDSHCASLGGVSDDVAIIDVAGSEASNSDGCQAVVDGFGFSAVVQEVSGADCQDSGLGCFFNVAQSLRCTSPTTTTEATASFIGGGRYCACDIAASSGFTDPHFAGFNGEILDIKHDKQASNNYFNIFCRSDVAVNALFSPNPEELLYMTEFYAKFGSFEMVFNLKGFFPAGEFTLSENGKYEIEDGYVKSEEGKLTVYYNNFIYNFKKGSMGKDTYLDMYVQGPRRNQVANGIVGRTLTRSYSPQEYEIYSHFLRTSPEDYSCEL